MNNKLTPYTPFLIIVAFYALMAGTFAWLYEYNLIAVLLGFLHVFLIAVACSNITKYEMNAKADAVYIRMLTELKIDLCDIAKDENVKNYIETRIDGLIVRIK